MTVKAADLNRALTSLLKTAPSPLTATELHRVSTTIFNRPLSQERTRYYLTELNDKPGLRALFNLTIKIISEIDRGRESLSLPAEPMQALLSFCLEHLSNWDVQTLKGDASVRNAYAKALEENFPKTGPVHLPTGAPVDKNFLEPPPAIHGPLIVGTKGANQPLLDLLYKFDIDPRSIIFATRMVVALENGELAKLCGEEVEVTGIQEVGDKHLGFYLNKLSPGALMGVVTPWDGTVSGYLNFWQRLDGKIENASLPFKFESTPFNINGLNDRLDKVGVAAASQLLEEGRAIVDCAKLVTLTGKQSGKTYKIIYKGFNPVVVESFIMVFLKAMGLPGYGIHLQGDQYGRFAWVDYLEHRPISEENAAALLDQANLRLFGEYVGWGYVLGLFDLNDENLLFPLDGNALTRIDLETALLSQPSPPFDNYLAHILEDLAGGLYPSSFCDAVQTGLREVMGGTAFVMRHFGPQPDHDFGQTLTKAIQDNLLGTGARYRLLLQKTRYYLFEDPKVSFQLGGVVPYYETDVDKLSLAFLSRRIESFTVS